MITKTTQHIINTFEEEDLLPLVCAAAALRHGKYLRALIERAKLIGVKEKPLYESLLQNYLFTGYPSAIISLKIYKEYFPKFKNNSYESLNLNKYSQRGTKNCKKIYGRTFEKLISNVKSFSPELSDWLLLEGYGKVLGRKGLSLKKRELNNVAVLTVIKFEDQLYSHINGAFRTKSTTNEIKNVITNLKIFGKAGLSSFGMRVLNRYLKQKGIG